MATTIRVFPKPGYDVGSGIDHVATYTLAQFGTAAPALLLIWNGGTTLLTVMDSLGVVRLVVDGASVSAADASG